MTVSPLGRRYFSNLRSGSAARAGIAQSAAARTKTRRSTCCLLPKGTALLLPTLPRRKPTRHAPSPSSQARWKVREAGRNVSLLAQNGGEPGAGVGELGGDDHVAHRIFAVGHRGTGAL